MPNERSSRNCSGTSTTALAGYAFDGAGNETKIIPAHETESSTFEYDTLNQLEGLTPQASAKKAKTP